MRNDDRDKTVGIWKHALGHFFTGGGDPVWECPRCGKGTHVHGIEHPKRIEACENCGMLLDYPEDRGMKVKCAIPARIKQCGDCEHYIAPAVISTMGGEINGTPLCLVGRNLVTQKAPCPCFQAKHINGEICCDNRFELIKKYRQKMIAGTNIETSPDEMKVLDSILFRAWQLGWLDKLDQDWHYPDKGDFPPDGEEVLLYVATRFGERTIVGYRDTDSDLHEGGGHVWGWYDIADNVLNDFIDDEIVVLAWMPKPEHPRIGTC